MKFLQRFLPKTIALAILFILPLALVARAHAETTPTLTSDKEDYGATDTVTLTGSGYQADTAYDLNVTSTGNYNLNANVTSDPSGFLQYQFALDGIYRPLYNAIISLGGIIQASHSFTDKPAVNLDQCANGPIGSPVACTGSAWQNGNLGQSQAHYIEGDTVPYRAIVTGTSTGETYTVKIEYDTTQSGKHAEDYLKTFTATEATADPCSGVVGIPIGECATPATGAILPDSNVSNAGVTQVPGNFTIYNGSITAVSPYTLTGTYAGNSSTSLVVSFTSEAGGTVVLAWGGHISTREDWGDANSAINISGSPYHMRVVDFTCTNPSNCGSGNQDRSLSAEAIIFPAELSITKVASPESSQLFGFTTTGTGLSSFSLNDDGDANNGTSDVKTFSLTDFGNKTVTETAVSGWALTNLACTDSSNNSSVNLGTRTASLSVQEGDVIACTYTNTLQQGTLTIVKNTDGGDDAFDFTVTGPTASTPSITTVDGTGTTGAITVNAGVYSISESVPEGWNLDSATCTSGTPQSLTVPPDGSVTCTFNNEKDATLTVIKHVINDDGGLATANDFTMNVDGVDVSDASFPGDEAGTTVTLSAGQYTVTEDEFSGYTGSLSEDCTGTIAYGEEKTCTVTNDDQPGTLIVKKVVVNDNGGTMHEDDFSFAVNGSTAVFFEEDGQNDLTVDAGTYDVVEPAVTGYTTTYDNCTDVVIPNGGTATCTVTNNDQPGTLIVEKVVSNDNGGTKEADDFSFQVNDGAVTPFEEDAQNSQTVDAGTYSVTELTVDGYVASYQNCSQVLVTNGGTATCTITNDDQPGTLIVKKVLPNDSGSTKTFTDFTFAVDGDEAVAFDADGQNEMTVDAGTYNVVEPEVEGFDTTYDNCSDIVIPNGGEAICTITNDDQPAHLTVIKHVINDNGGTSVAADFTMNVSGTDVSDDSFPGSETGTTVDLDAGEYSATESGVIGYAESLGENCSGTIANGQTKVCTITNDDIAPSLTLVKEVINDNGGSAEEIDWTLTAVGSTGISGTTGVTSDNEFESGTYSLSESGGPTGYSASDWSCVGGTQDGSNITLALAESATCTITNDDISPRLTVIKEVENSFGGTATSSGFTMLVNATNPSESSFPGSVDGVEITLDAGSYSVDETGPAGYEKTSSIGCEGTVGVGEEVTCTLVNEDMPGSLSGLKFEDHNGNGVQDQGDQGLTNWTIYLDSDNNGTLDLGEPSTTTVAGGAYHFDDLSMGDYVVREVLPAGWTQTFPATGSHEVTVDLGEDILDLNFGNFRNFSVGGFKWHDLSGDGLVDGDEEKLAGWTIFVDANDNNTLDVGEVSTVTGANGNYSLTNLGPSATSVCEVMQTAWTQTFPALNGTQCYSVTPDSGVNVTARNFGNMNEHEGTIGFWRNWNRHNKFTEAQINGWMVTIDGAPSWLMPNGYPLNTTGIVKLIDDATKYCSKNFSQLDCAKNKFMAQYMVTRLNVLSGKKSLGITYNLSNVSGVAAYLGLPNNATLGQIFTKIESKFGTNPTRQQFLLMMSLADYINNQGI